MPFQVYCTECDWSINGDFTTNSEYFLGGPCGKCGQYYESIPVPVEFAGVAHIPGLHSSEKPVVWEDPRTGEVRYPGRTDAPMPEAYRKQGYRVREFSSYYEHQKFCKERGLVNHKAEGIGVDTDALKRNKWGY